MRCLKLLVIGISSWMLVCPAAITSAQQEGAELGQTSGGESGAGDMPANQRPYQLMHADGTSEEGFYTAFHSYVLAPGWAKPRRWLGSSNSMGGGKSYLSIRSGQSKRSTKSESQIALSAQSIPVDAILIAALVLAKAEGDAHAKVIVGKTQQSMMGGMGSGFGAMPGGGYGGMGGMPGMSAGGDGGMMGGGLGGGIGGMGGGMGGMGDTGEMTAAMGMGGMAGPVKVVLVPLEECRIPVSGRLASESPFTVAQLKNLADLVRVDCWIEEELATLRAVRQDAEKFKTSEGRLKDLLSKEYELQLGKQREDIERLNEKLKALQGELTRRASAQDRVVDVQLGQLILEAQGLIGERP